MRLMEFWLGRSLILTSMVFIVSALLIFHPGSFLRHALMEGDVPRERRWRETVFDREKTSPHSLQLVVCTLVKDENKFLPEWIEFHALQGVDKFVIYDHHSNEGPYQQLSPYISSGLVEVIPWPPPLSNLTRLGKIPESLWQCEKFNASIFNAPHLYTSCQRSAFSDCTQRYARKSKWLGIWDVDEFLFADLSKSYCGINPLVGGCFENIISRHNLLAVMNDAYEESGTNSFRFRGVVFGDNGFQENPEPACPLNVPLMTEQFLFRQPFSLVKGKSWLWRLFHKSPPEPDWLWAQKQIVHTSTILTADNTSEVCHWLHKCECCKGVQEFKWNKVEEERVLRMHHYQVGS